MKVKVNKKKMSIILVLVLVVFLTGNAFAALVGAPNIFFAIKDLVVQEEVSGEENLLSDKDITISYSPIKIKDGVKLQINRILIEEDKSTLFINLKNENENDEEIGFNVYDLLENENINDVIAEEKLLVESDESKNFEVALEKSVSETEKILIEIIIDRKEVGRNIIIDLDSKEIIVKGEEEISKVSQVELKEYLGCFALLNAEQNTTTDWLIYVADRINENILKVKNPDSHSELVMNIIDSFYSEDYETTKVNGEEILKVETILYMYDESEDEYIQLVEFSEAPVCGLCLDINDISYKDGIYTVEFTYCLPTTYDYDFDRIEELEQYKATIKLELNEDSEFSKYKIVSLEDGEIIENKIENADCEHNYVVKEWDYSAQSHTTLDGTHELVCTECNDVKTEKHNFTEWNDLSSDIANVWTLWCADCKGYVYTSDENVVKESGYKVKPKEECEHNYIVKQWDYSTQSHTTLDGTHELVCTECNDVKTEKHNYTHWYDISYAWTLWCTDCKGYVYTEDENVVKESGYIVEVTQDTTEENVTKEMVYTLKNNGFKSGKEYEIYYFDEVNNYKFVNSSCEKDGELDFIMTESGTYKIGIIVDKNSENYEYVNECVGIQLEADSETGIVTVLKQNVNTEMSYTLKNDAFKFGYEYEIYYFDEANNYKSVKSVSKRDGELDFVITESGTYKIGIIMDRTTPGFEFINDCGVKLQANSEAGEVIEVQ